MANDHHSATSMSVAFRPSLQKLPQPANAAVDLQCAAVSLLIEHAWLVNTWPTVVNTWPTVNTHQQQHRVMSTYRPCHDCSGVPRFRMSR